MVVEWIVVLVNEDIEVVFCLWLKWGLGIIVNWVWKWGEMRIEDVYFEVLFVFYIIVKFRYKVDIRYIDIFRFCLINGKCGWNFFIVFCDIKLV